MIKGLAAFKTPRMVVLADGAVPFQLLQFSATKALIYR
jgi:hypothetical protein